MEEADSFLASKYIEYRKAFKEVKTFAPLIPYGWFKPPQTIRLDTEFGLQQMAYRDLADDAARDLANGINHLIGLTMRLEGVVTLATTDCRNTDLNVVDTDADTVHHQLPSSS